MASRRAFTLLELLVVISVIGVLASLLIPVIGMVRVMVRDSKCGNNLQQIASAIEAYKAENTDQFPDHLIGDPSNAANLSNLVSLGGPLTGLPKVFICPYDTANGGGMDKNMGRGYFDSGSGNVSGLYDGGTINGVPAFSSYCFEASGFLLDQPNTEASSTYFTIDDLSTLRAAGVTALTMFMAKKNELQYGLADGNTYSGPFSPSLFPIIRCFFHYKWSPASKNINKVLNVSWNLNVIKTIPYWETALNPNITN